MFIVYGFSGWLLKLNPHIFNFVHISFKRISEASRSQPWCVFSRSYTQPLLAAAILKWMDCVRDTPVRFTRACRGILLPWTQRPDAAPQVGAQVRHSAWLHLLSWRVPWAAYNPPAPKKHQTAGFKMHVVCMKISLFGGIWPKKGTADTARL